MSDAYQPLSTDAPRPALRIRLARPDVGEEELAAVSEVLNSGILTNGPATRGFEKAFAQRHQVQHAVAFANGTVALSAMYIGLGIGPGDEVIVPSLTFISTATSVLHVGATPIFADVDVDTFNVDSVDVCRKLGPRTRAVVAVHYGGQPADLAELRTITDEAGIHLLEDAAEAHGASYRGRPVGGHGTAGMFSFTPTKNITTGEGGMVTTDNGDLADHLRLLRNHGQTGQYRHEYLGWNWRLSELQSALGRSQMAKLEAILSRKRSNAVWLTERLAAIPGVRPPVVRPDRDHVYMLYTVLLDTDRDLVMQRLVADGIEARLYFPPAHRQPVFSSVSTSLPVTDDVSSRMLSLPFHSRLTTNELGVIADALESAVAAK